MGYGITSHLRSTFLNNKKCLTRKSEFHECRRAKTALAREKRSGLTLEFSPHDSTLLQIEGIGNKITRITKMVIVIEDKISETKDYALHKGTRDSSPVCVYVVKLSEATYDAAKRAIVARDQASDS